MDILHLATIHLNHTNVVRRGGFVRRMTRSLGWSGLDGLEESTDRTAAHEVHHFEAVSLVELGFTPSISRDDVAIQLHCHAVSLHAQDFYERAKGEWSNRARELTRFPIDL
jgi:hypothetical protein